MKKLLLRLLLKLLFLMGGPAAFNACSTPITIEEVNKLDFSRFSEDDYAKIFELDSEKISIEAIKTIVDFHIFFRTNTQINQVPPYKDRQKTLAKIYSEKVFDSPLAKRIVSEKLDKYNVFKYNSKEIFDEVNKYFKDDDVFHKFLTNEKEFLLKAQIICKMYKFRRDNLCENANNFFMFDVKNFEIRKRVFMKFELKEEDKNLFFNFCQKYDYFLLEALTYNNDITSDYNKRHNTQKLAENFLKEKLLAGDEKAKTFLERLSDSDKDQKALKDFFTKFLEDEKKKTTVSNSASEFQSVTDKKNKVNFEGDPKGVTTTNDTPPATEVNGAVGANKTSNKNRVHFESKTDSIIDVEYVNKMKLSSNETKDNNLRTFYEEEYKYLEIFQLSEEDVKNISKEAIKKIVSARTFKRTKPEIETVKATGKPKIHQIYSAILFDSPLAKRIIEEGFDKNSFFTKNSKETLNKLNEYFQDNVFHKYLTDDICFFQQVHKITDMLDFRKKDLNANAKCFEHCITLFELREKVINNFELKEEDKDLFFKKCEQDNLFLNRALLLISTNDSILKTKKLAENFLKEKLLAGDEKAKTFLERLSDSDKDQKALKDSFAKFLEDEKKKTTVSAAAAVTTTDKKSNKKRVDFESKTDAKKVATTNDTSPSAAEVTGAASDTSSSAEKKNKFLNSSSVYFQIGVQKKFFDSVLTNASFLINTKLEKAVEISGIFVKKFNEVELGAGIKLHFKTTTPNPFIIIYASKGIVSASISFNHKKEFSIALSGKLNYINAGLSFHK